MVQKTNKSVRRKKRYIKKKPLSKAEYKAVARIATKQIHKHAELKRVNTSLANYNVRDLSVIPNPFVRVTFPTRGASGPGANERDGDEVFLRSVNLRCILDCDNDQAMSMRCIVLQWLEDDAISPPTIDKVLENGAGAAGPTAINSYYKIKPDYRFKILDDRTYFWSSNVTNSPKPWEVRLNKFAMRKPEFNPGAGVLTGKGNIYYAFFSAATATGVGTGQVKAMTERVAYLDG